MFLPIKRQLFEYLKLLIDSPWKIILIFSVLGLFGILNHSMWRDEMNTWLIVRDSDSFSEMVNNVHYQGHPLLWAICVSLVRNITDNPLIMQLFHLSLAISSISIFWLYSPFNYRQKSLFTFGYFPFYEYCLIARPYALGTLFLLTFCATFNYRQKTYLMAAFLLGLMANTNVYPLLVSLALSSMLLLELVFNQKHRKTYFKQAKKYDLSLSIVILIVLYIIAIYIILPPGDSNNHGGLDEGWVFYFDFHRLLIALVRLIAGYFIIIPSSSQWLDFDLILCALIAVFIFGLTLIKLVKKPLIFWFYLSANLAIFAFTYVKFLGSTRHFGFLYLTLITAFWLANYYPNSNFLVNKFKLKSELLNVVKKWHYIAFMIILYVQFLGGIIGFSRDALSFHFTNPYSASRQTANYIQKNDLNNEFIVASEDATMAALSGYLNRKFYYPELQRIGSFTLFTKERQEISHSEVLKQVNFLLKNDQSLAKILLILNSKLEINETNLNITPLQSFEKSLIRNEKFYLYFLSEKI